MQEYSRSLGDVIKRARGKLGLTQNEVADAADIDVRTVLNIENYKGNPKMEVLYKIIVKIVDRVADNHLKLPGLCECTFGRFQRLDFGNICLGRVIQNKAHTRYAVRYRRNVLFSADILKQ